MKRLTLVKIAAALLTIGAAVVHKEGNLFGMMATIAVFYFIPVQAYKYIFEK